MPLQVEICRKCNYINRKQSRFVSIFNETRIKMGQQHNKIEKRNRRKAYLARKREQVKALIKK